MQPFVKKSNPDDDIVIRAKVINDFNARFAFPLKVVMSVGWRVPALINVFQTSG